jgi:hypothetical protein
MIITHSKYFICDVTFAGKDVLQCNNVYERIYYDSLNYEDIFINNEIFLDRSNMIGYTNVKNNHDKNNKDNNKSTNNLIRLK